MLNTKDYASFLPGDLLEQIEELCKLFKTMQSETAAILHRSNVPDASAQLQDVLDSTEAATHAIIDSVGSILSAIEKSGASAEDKQQVGNLVTRVYEACNFQDVTGQRIKKVLGYLVELDARITKLAGTARAYEPTEPVSTAGTPSLMGGPQLSAEAPKQEDVDNLFKSA